MLAKEYLAVSERQGASGPREAPRRDNADGAQSEMALRLRVIVVGWQIIEPRMALITRIKAVNPDDRTDCGTREGGILVASIRVDGSKPDASREMDLLPGTNAPTTARSDIGLE